MLKYNISKPQRDYSRWRSERTEAETELGNVLDRIWALLRHEVPEREFEREFNYIIMFILRVQVRQNNMIKSLCRQRNIDYWDTLVIRAGHFFEHLRPQMGDVGHNLAKFEGGDTHAYIFVVFRNSLIHCNNHLIDELYNPNTQSYDDGVMGDGSEDGGIPAAKQPVRHSTSNFGEILTDLHNKEGAKAIYAMIKDDWGKNKINLLCHYYEKLSGVKSERLLGEKPNNIHKHHQRLRETMIGWVEQGVFEKDALKVFFAIYMPKLCQETEAMSTYKQAEHSRGENHENTI